MYLHTVQKWTSLLTIINNSDYACNSIGKIIRDYFYKKGNYRLGYKHDKSYLHYYHYPHYKSRKDFYKIAVDSGNGTTVGIHVNATSIWLNLLQKERSYNFICDSVNETDRICLSSVDGNFSQWNTWTECSVTCGGAMKVRTRTCDNPAPIYGGKNCSGNFSETIACNDFPCLNVIDGEELSYLNNFTTTCQNRVAPFSCRLTLSKQYKISKLIFPPTIPSRTSIKVFITKSDFPIYKMHKVSSLLNYCSTRHTERKKWILIQCSEVKVGQYVHIFFYNSIHYVRINKDNILIAAVDKDEECYVNFDTRYDPKIIEYTPFGVIYRFEYPTSITLLQFLISRDNYYGNIKVYAKDNTKRRLVNDVDFDGVQKAEVFTNCLTREIEFIFKSSRKRKLLEVNVIVHTNRYHNIEINDKQIHLYYLTDHPMTIFESLSKFNDISMRQKFHSKVFMVSFVNEIDIAFIRIAMNLKNNYTTIGFTVGNTTRYQIDLTSFSWENCTSCIYGNIKESGGVVFGRANFILWTVESSPVIFQYIEIFAERFIPWDPKIAVKSDSIRSIAKKELNLTAIYQEDMSNITIPTAYPSSFTILVQLNRKYLISSVKLHTINKISEKIIKVKGCRLSSNNEVYMADFYCSGDIATDLVDLTFSGMTNPNGIIRLKVYFKEDDYPTIRIILDPSGDNKLHKISCEASHPNETAGGFLVDNQTYVNTLKMHNGHTQSQHYSHNYKSATKVACLINNYLSSSNFIQPDCNYGNVSHFNFNSTNSEVKLTCDLGGGNCSLVSEIINSFNISQNSSCDFILKPQRLFEGFLYCYSNNSEQVLFTNKVYFIHKLHHWRFNHPIKIESKYIDQSLSLPGGWSILQRPAALAMDDTSRSSRTIVQDYPEWTAYLSGVCVDVKVGIDYGQFFHQFNKVKVQGRQDKSFIDCKFGTDTYQCGEANPIDLIKILLDDKQTALILPNVEVECGYLDNNIQLKEEQFKFVNGTLGIKCGKVIQLENTFYINQIDVRTIEMDFSVELEYNGNKKHFNRPKYSSGNLKNIYKPKYNLLYPAKFIYFRSANLNSGFCGVRIFIDSIYEPLHTTIEHSSPIKWEKAVHYTLRTLDLANTELYDEDLTTCIKHNSSSVILNLYQVVTLIKVKLFHKPTRIINVHFNVISKYIDDDKTISDYDCGSFYGNVYRTNDPGWMNIFCHRRSVIALIINSDNSQWSLCEIALYGFHESNLLTVDKKDAVLSSAYSLTKNRAENCIDFDLKTKCQSSIQDPRINPQLSDDFTEKFYQWLQLDLSSVKYIDMVFVIDEKLTTSFINYIVQVSEFTEYFQSYEYGFVDSQIMIFTVQQQGRYVRVVKNQNAAAIILNDVLVFGIDYSTVKLNSIPMKSSALTCLSDGLIFNKNCFSIGTRNTNFEIQFQKTELALVIIFVSYRVTETKNYTIKFFDDKYPNKCPSWYSNILSSRISLKCEIVTQSLVMKFENPSFDNIEFHEIVLYASLNTKFIREITNQIKYRHMSSSTFDPTISEDHFTFSSDEFYAVDDISVNTENELYQYGEYFQIEFRQTVKIYSVRVIIKGTSHGNCFYRNPHHFRISGLNEDSQLFEACAHFPYQVSVGLIVHLKCNISTRVLRLTDYDNGLDLDNVDVEVFEQP